MDIAIIGAGNSGCALAADYSARGHRVKLIKSSQSIHDDNFNYLLENGGEMTLDEFGRRTVCKIHTVTRDLDQVRDCAVVILCLQTGWHRPVLERLVPRLSPGQLLLINPGYLSTAYVLSMDPPPGLIIAETESTFIDGRIIAPGKFRVGFRNVRNPVGIYPRALKERGIALLERLGSPFTYLESVAEAALHNPNMIVHTVGAVMSIPRIEATGGDYCMYHEVFTPSVWKILEALDGEKIGILRRLGYAPLSYVEACKHRNSLDDESDAREVFFAYAAMPTRAKGPVNVRSRYITEDVPQGLVLMESVGRSLGMETPVCSALIELASAALGEDMRLHGRSLEALGLENVRAILKDGRGGGADV